MINSIDIQKFGLFSDYKWKSEVVSDHTFKKLNIIYGRNYSGKTTISRILRCVEKKEIHKNYLDAKFTLSTDEGSIIETNLNYPQNIRVYNSDFVKENLSWLHNEDGEILPFALLGAENDVIERRLIDIDKSLGKLDEETGKYPADSLYYKKIQKEDTKNKTVLNQKTLRDELTKRLTDKANRSIKTNPNYCKQGTTYNVTNIQREIEDISTNNLNCTLTSEEISKLEAIIKEEKKDPISKILSKDWKFRELITSTKELISKDISLSNTLKELVENDLIQDWVNKGRDLHKASKVCAFCGNPFTPQRRKQLDEHFSKESEELSKNINDILGKLDTFRADINNYLKINNIERELFYVSLQEKYDTIQRDWGEALVLQKEQIVTLEEKLKERQNNLFKPIKDVDFSEIVSSPVDLSAIIVRFNALIGENEAKSDSLLQDKDKAIKSLRYNAIQTFLTDIKYPSLLNEITKAEQEKENAEREFNRIKEDISNLEDEKKQLENDSKDEGRAAEKINKHIKDFFGHDGIKLDPIEAEENGNKRKKFVIKRGSVEAKNLSEGECSLIAFCYFIAKMEDELQDSNANDNLIIYIDDPISSLDSNHIFFMFSLIESVICKGGRYHQLFISTHNLDFLKYTKRLTHPNKNTGYFMVIKEKKCEEVRCSLMLMPNHLKDYVTEYNFLFKEIYRMAQPVDGERYRVYENEFSQFYNLPNNMRKFLECYLFYRFPNTENPLGYLDKLFDSNIPALVNRVVNEYSHLSWGDRGTLVMDVSEAETVSKEILKALKSKDNSHFEALCNSVGVDTNIAL
jgi:wobble nucleotide-excising tRNase